MIPSVVAYAPMEGSAPCGAKPCFARRERVYKYRRMRDLYGKSDKARNIMNECHPRFSRNRGKQ
jgi:hypothetical protein